MTNLVRVLVRVSADGGLLVWVSIVVLVPGLYPQEPVLQQGEVAQGVLLGDGHRGWGWARPEPPCILG